MVALAGGSLLAGIAIVAVISSILGMGLPITSGYIIVSTLGAPALTEFGMSVLGAHLMIFWFAQSATITPPICMTAFVAAQIAGAGPMRTGFETLRVAKALYFVPLLFAYTRILSGAWIPMLLDALAGMLLLLVFPVLTVGFFGGWLGVPARLVVAAAGVFFFVSTFSLNSLPSAVWLALGLLLIGCLSLYQHHWKSGAAAAPQTFGGGP